MQNETATPPRHTSLVARIAERYSVDPDKMLATLKATAFKQSNGADISNEQMMSLLVIADQYRLNPFLKQIHAFADKGGIVPVVGIDGWARIVNEHEAFDGVRFEYDEEKEICTCIMYRRDRSHATEVPEKMSECKRNTGPWQSHPRRMLRHKAYIQCARLAFGFAGIYDEDEATRIIEGGNVEPEPETKIEATRKRLQRKPEPFHVEPSAPQEDAKAPMMVDGQTGEFFDHIEAEKNEQA